MRRRKTTGERDTETENKRCCSFKYLVGYFPDFCNNVQQEHMPSFVQSKAIFPAGNCNNANAST